MDFCTKVCADLLSHIGLLSDKDIRLRAYCVYHYNGWSLPIPYDDCCCLETLTTNSIFTCLFSQHFTAFSGHQIFIACTWNKIVKQWLNWYFLIVSLHKHRFQLPSVWYQPIKQEHTSSPTCDTSLPKSAIHKFNSTDSTFLSPCSLLFHHAQKLFWMISCNTLNTVSKQSWIVLIIIHTPPKSFDRTVV